VSLDCIPGALLLVSNVELWAPGPEAPEPRAIADSNSERPAVHGLGFSTARGLNCGVWTRIGEAPARNPDRILTIRGLCPYQH
jgi:hypothetical protein